jgi:hypothetical protein
MQCHRHEPRICAPRKLLTAVQQIRMEDRVRRTRKTLKLFLMSHLRSFSSAIESLTLTSGSVEDMLLAGQDTDLDWNVLLRMWRRITQARRLLRLPRARSVKKTALKRMTDFDDVTFQEQFRFTKAEFLFILSNMQDQNGADLTDEESLPVMIGSGKRDYIRCRSDSRSWFCRGVFPDGVRCVICRFYWAVQGPASPGFSDSCSPWSTGDMTSWCRT